LIDFETSWITAMRAIHSILLQFDQTPLASVFFVAWLLFGFSTASAAPALLEKGSTAPCIAISEACTEWIAPKGSPQRVLVYRSYPLEKRNNQIVSALVMVHGGLRNAEDQFTNELAASFLSGHLSDVILIAPRFASNTAPEWCHDKLGEQEANWICEDSRADSWRNGMPAIGNAKLTSFDIADEIVRRLADKKVFPNLKHIVIAGHSGGGQFALRYAMANQVHDTGVTLSYVVSNPDAFVYLDGLRPTPAAYPPAAAGPRFIPPNPNEAFTPFSDARHCATFNDWQYGLRNRAGYTATQTDEQLKRQLTSRTVTYLLGSGDMLQFGGFDDSCPAMAQGPTRLARGLAYAKYITELHGAKHQAVVVEGCGHNDRCIFTAKQALPLLFP
jgi:pimeloyl-ACP methyl ester carboxylesterase